MGPTDTSDCLSGSSYRDMIGPWNLEAGKTAPPFGLPIETLPYHMLTIAWWYVNSVVGK